MAMEETITPRAPRSASTSRLAERAVHVQPDSVTDHLTGESMMWGGMRRSRGRHGRSTPSPVGFRELFVQNFRSVALAPKIIPAFLSSPDGCFMRKRS